MVKELPSPEFFKTILLDTISNSKSPIILTKQYKISKQLLSYYLKSLKDKGLIVKLEKGHWQIVKDNLELSSKRKSRGHAFIWIIKFHNKIKNWDKREEILSQNNINFTKTGNTIRIIINNKKVWLNNKTIIIYEPKSFYATMPIETRKLAIYELKETVKSLEHQLKLNLGKYNFKTKREHIAWINDNLAIQCNKEGQKIRVIDKGECWMEVDNSHNEDETEFYLTPSNSAVVNSTGYNRYYNSHKKTNWNVTPEFTLESINKLTNAIAQTSIQLLEYKEQNKEHLKLIQEYRQESKSNHESNRLLQETIKELKEIISKK